MHDEHNTERSEDTAPPDETAPPLDDGRPADGAASDRSEADDEQPADGAGADRSEADDGQPADGTGTDRSKADDIDRLQRERDEYYERLLRTTADFDNYRKRTDRERRELAEHAALALLTDLLLLVDDFERALAADTQDGDVDRRGVEIIYKQLLDLLAARGVAPIEALGADFDPNLHQAVAHEPSEAHRDGEVIEFSQMGFQEKPDQQCLLEMGGHGSEEATNIASETLIRGMYEYWRRVMGV